MSRKSQSPSATTSWDVYKAASKAKLIGTVEATDADAAIEKAAQEFKVEAKKLIAVR